MSSNEPRHQLKRIKVIGISEKNYSLFYQPSMNALIFTLPTFFLKNRDLELEIKVKEVEK